MSLYQVVRFGEEVVFIYWFFVFQFYFFFYFFFGVFSYVDFFWGIFVIDFYIGGGLIYVDQVLFVFYIDGVLLGFDGFFVEWFFKFVCRVFCYVIYYYVWNINYFIEKKYYLLFQFKRYIYVYRYIYKQMVYIQMYKYRIYFC